MLNFNCLILTSSRAILFISIIALLGFNSCSKNNEPTANGTGIDDCKGETSFVLEGLTYNFEDPLTAEFKYNNALDMHEFIITWNNSTGLLSFQVVIDLKGAECFGSNQIIDLDNLPSEITVASLQFSNLSESINASHLLEGTSGFIEFTSCNETNKTMSFNFEFTGTDFFGDNKKDVTQGKAINICYIIT